MTWAAFRSEWIKLRRPSLFLSTLGGLAAASSLFVILVFTQARATGGGDGLPNLVQLSQPGGLVHGLNRAAVLLGIVAFGIAATQIASEYSLGTLRQLLVRQPRRVVLLAGKLAGTVSFMLVALVFASVVALLVAVVAAHARHIPTGPWFTTTGVADLLRALGDLALAVVGFSLLGLAVGLLLRSSVAAVIVGFAWLLPIEAVVVRIFPGTEAWLPGSALQLVAEGGTPGFGYGAALLVAGAYVAVALAGTVALFVRRDVTA
ncbi:MAG TPA: ABC transporter permease [Acidimicrobiales bacterium]|jgi:ABC-type transport system involved in multi-copper enzyme maturation permease subunit|nr:ABC transporter permease [Acidimicrobiales bacterium]